MLKLLLAEKGNSTFSPDPEKLRRSNNQDVQIIPFVLLVRACSFQVGKMPQLFHERADGASHGVVRTVARCVESFGFNRGEL
jgi:hypothetical protein